MKPEAGYEQMTCAITQDNRSDFPRLHTVKLPGMIRHIYGGDLNFVKSPEDCAGAFAFLNFVIGKDGVFNLKHLPGGGPISKGNQADAFCMALLRAVADGVMVGAGTLNGEPDHIWDVDFIFDKFPQMAGKESLRAAFKQWRRDLGRADKHPPTFLMTNSGKIDFSAAVFRNSGIKKYIVTGARGAKWLRSEGGMTEAKLAAINTNILTYGDDTLDSKLMMRDIREHYGIEYLLHEGGRGVADALIREGLIDQLFLTRMGHALADEAPADQLEHLFTSLDHGHPVQAKVLTVRKDNTDTAELYTMSLDGVPHL